MSQLRTIETTAKECLEFPVQTNNNQFPDWPTVNQTNHFVNYFLSKFSMSKYHFNHSAFLLRKTSHSSVLGRVLSPKMSPCHKEHLYTLRRRSLTRKSLVCLAKLSAVCTGFRIERHYCYHDLLFFTIIILTLLI